MQIHNSLRSAIALGTFMLAIGAHASVFYKFEVAAETGLPGGFEEFNSAVSINDNGQLAFAAEAPLDEKPEYYSCADVFIAERDAPPSVGLKSRRVSYLPGCSTLGPIRAPQMNNAGKIVLSYVASSWDAWHRTIMVLDSNQPKENIETNMLHVAGMNSIGGWFASELGGTPTINNKPFHEVRNAWSKVDLSGNNDGVCDSGETCVEQIAFSRVTGPYDSQHPNGQGYLSTLLETPTFEKLPDDTIDWGLSNDLPLTLYARPRIADTGEIVVRDGNLATDPVVLYDYQLTAASRKEIAGPSNGFTSLGSAPNISADGKIVVFIGDRGKGMGVFASVDDGSPERKLIRVAGENNTPHPELGYSIIPIPASGVNPQPLYFKAFRQPYRVGVTHLARGRPGMMGDSFIVGFTATPSGASRINPVIGNRPITFTDKEGIWTVRVDIEEPLKDICITPGADGILDSPGPDETIENLSSPKIAAELDLITVVKGSAGTCPNSPSNDDESNYHVRSPLPVVQIGDRLVGAGPASYAIDTLATHDVLAAVLNDDNGASRTMRPGDHRVAFFAASGNKQFIVSATHLDSDQDGLLDHWENEGIDSDQDGAIDLNLGAMGAQPCHRDLFVEIDWLNDQPGGVNRPHKNRPAPGVSKALADMFKGAPAPVGEDPLAPCAIGPGIAAHIDAGPGLDSQGGAFTQNMPGGFVEGGDIITEAAVSPRHINLVYMGLPNSILIPGVVTRSLHDIKDRFFGTQDKRARELAFHYIVLADYYETLLDKATLSPVIFQVKSSTANSVTNTGINFGPDFRGYHLMIAANGHGETTNRSGQVRRIAAAAGETLEVSGRWKIPPVAGDQFILLAESTGLGEMLLRQDYSSAPGNDVIIALGGFGNVQRGLTPAGELGNTLIQSRIIAHELGHNFGLRHGGDDHETGNPGTPGYKPGYVSLMNYFYVSCKPGISNPCPSSYSSDMLLPPYPAAFNDWQHLRLDFFSANYSIGNSVNFRGKPASIVDGDIIIDSVNDDEPTTTDMLSLLSPAISKIRIVSPSDDATVALGQPLKVQAKLNGVLGPAVVSIYFDEDGDGSIDPATERFAAMPMAADTYEVILNPVAGTTGWRSLSAQVEEANGGRDEVAQGVTVVSADLDNDGDIDQADINLVLALRGTPATDPSDSRDLDGDGQITALDARKLVTLCTRARCATN